MKLRLIASRRTFNAEQMRLSAVFGGALLPRAICRHLSSKATAQRTSDLPLRQIRVGLLTTCCMLLLVSNLALAQPPVKKPGKSGEKPAGQAKQIERATESDKFFASPRVVKLKLEIPPAELQKLRDDNRNYVRCNLIEDGKTTYQSVAVKLKGAAGSFREIDDRPALTLNTSKYTKQQIFHGLDKFHLNNSVQDETYLNEYLCADLFRRAGQPVPRVTHARVWLNGRDLGLYVLKEGFDRKFLQRHFADATGNLYDGGFCQDLDTDLEKDTGDGPDDRSDLQAVRAACAEPDPATRWKRIAERVDVNKFIDFMAMELMTGHWDGYSLTKNNYRVYFDPKTNQAHFFAHGMDQMFGDPGASILDYPGAIVAAAVMQNPVWRAKYRTRIKELLPLFTPPKRLLELVDVQQKRLQPVLREMNEDQANAFQDRVAELKQRLIDRAANLIEQVSHPEPAPLEFNAEGIAGLEDWYEAHESGGVTHERVELPGKQTAYSIKCENEETCIASWRRKVLLPQGHYLFQARAKTGRVVPLEDEKGSGVGLRVSGANRSQKLSGTSDWKPLEFEFEVLEDVREVELVAEIRATAGQVWFDMQSMRLKKVP